MSTYSIVIDGDPTSAWYHTYEDARAALGTIASHMGMSVDIQGWTRQGPCTVACSGRFVDVADDAPMFDVAVMPTEWV